MVQINHVKLSLAFNSMIRTKHQTAAFQSWQWHASFHSILSNYSSRFPLNIETLNVNLNQIVVKTIVLKILHFSNLNSSRDHSTIRLNIWIIIKIRFSRLRCNFDSIYLISFVQNLQVNQPWRKKNVWSQWMDVIHVRQLFFQLWIFINVRDAEAWIRIFNSFHADLHSNKTIIKLHTL